MVEQYVNTQAQIGSLINTLQEKLNVNDYIKVETVQPAQAVAAVNDFNESFEGVPKGCNTCKKSVINKKFDSTDMTQNRNQNLTKSASSFCSECKEYPCTNDCMIKQSASSFCSGCNEFHCTSDCRVLSKTADSLCSEPIDSHKSAGSFLR